MCYKNLLLMRFITKGILLMMVNLYVNTSFSQIKNLDSSLISKHALINEFLSLTEKDVVADVGTSSGYSLVPIAGANTNITFTVEDIDSSTLNRKKLLAQIKRFGNKANIEQFKIVYGNETSTNLPSASYTKVLMFDVVHEMSERQTMLSDIRRILQKGGSLFIEEVLVYKPAKKERHCNYPFFTETAFKQLMLENKFILKKEKISLDTGHRKYMKLFEYIVAD
jgi:ubiquinone/menaquinone biosynthesis C-methylase UbiE